MTTTVRKATAVDHWNNLMPLTHKSVFDAMASQAPRAGIRHKNRAQAGNMAIRKFVAEGALHLFSSDPIALTPGDLRYAHQRPEVRDLVKGCNLYLITSRPRVWVEGAYLEQGTLKGDFAVMRDPGWVSVPFECVLPAQVAATASGLDVLTAASGTHVLLKCRNGDGENFLFPVHSLIAWSSAALLDDERDLHLLYVGQGLGRKKARTALDRLRRHETLQTILADHHTFHPEREILLLLYRFEHHRNLISTGGDLTLEPLASVDEERSHLGQMSQATLSRKERIALAEAALINHFKPIYNSTFKGTDFSRAEKIKTLRTVLREDLTGLIVEINTFSVKGRLGTEHRPHSDDPTIKYLSENVDARRKEGVDEVLYRDMCREVALMRHAHYAKFALTCAQEREMFLHGIGWRDSDEPVPFG